MRRIILVLAALIAAAPAAQAAVHFVRCKDVFLLGASGYPEPKRGYKLRGLCTVYTEYYDPKKFYSGDLPSKPVSEAFLAEGGAKFDGTLGIASEAVLIKGQKVHIKTKCVGDPFVQKTSCSGAQVSASVPGKLGELIATALHQSNQPIFNQTVNPTLAESLSKKAGAGGGSPPPPPPPPAPVKLDIAVYGLDVLPLKNGVPQKTSIKAGAAGVEYHLLCGFKPLGTAPTTTTRFLFKANGAVVRDVYAPVDSNKYISMGARWTPPGQGTYSLTCQANPDHKPGETSYANNQRAKSFPVKKLTLQTDAMGSLVPLEPATGPKLGTVRRLPTATPTPSSRRRG